MRRGRPRHLAPSLVAALLAALLALPAAPVAAGRSSAAPGATSTFRVTLVTGDTVHLTRFPGGREQAAVRPGPHAGGYRTFQRDGDLHVVPAVARPLLRDGTLDPRLFNVSDLVDAGYDDAHRDSLPLIVTYEGGARSLRAQVAPAGATVTRALPSISGLAVSARKHDAPTLWRALAGGSPLASRSAAPAGGIAKVWLDGRVRALLDESVPQVGAPAAWARGLDGSGATVAVLDTGVDTSHPDLAGAISGSRSFTPDGTVADRIGHGTHVASIVAGSGAASGGRYRGVAPGADLLVGKVLADNGFGQDSWIIAGLEWAAAQGADVANLSLGGAPSDGRDPLSLAVNRITDETGMLVVAAAGNDGRVPMMVAGPAAADRALAVGNVDKTGALNPRSSTGPRRRDNAIKPDITAPGTGIVAARGEGTHLGEELGEDYTRLSGTSMAAPHVAGAAAILAQQHPEWDADELKAALTSTATPREGLTVYQQGAGLLDVDRATRQAVHASRGILDLGYFPTGEPPTPSRGTVTYTNDGPTAVTLELAATVRDERGEPAPDGTVAVTPARLELPPGGSGEITVRVEPGGAPTGSYSGRLVARGGDGTVLGTALGFYLQGDLMDLTVEALDRHGRPAFASVTILNYHAHPWEPEGLWTTVGVAPRDAYTLRLPRGTYLLLARVATLDEAGREVEELSYLFEPQLDLQRSQVVTFDARRARPLEVRTRRDTDTSSLAVLWQRRGPEGVGFVDATILLPQAGEVERVSMAPTARVTEGSFDVHTVWNLRAPWLRMEVSGRGSPPLDPQYMVLSPRLDGRRRLELVDAGDGEAADYQGIDASGKVVLIRADPGADYQRSLRALEQAATAAAAGAALALIWSPRPGRFLGIAPGAPVPTAALEQDEGEALLRLLERGPVRLDLRGVAHSPYLYDLAFREEGGIGADLSYRVDPRDVAVVRNRFHGTGAGQRAFDWRALVSPGCPCLVPLLAPLPVPFERTEYVSAGVEWRQHVVVAGAGGLQVNDVTRGYRGGAVERHDWLRGPLVPGIPAGDDRDHATREGDELVFNVPAVTDSDPGHSAGSWHGGDLSGRLLRDGEVLHEFRFGAFGRVPVGPEPATYRLELDASHPGRNWATSISTRTAWTFRSAAGRDGPLPLVEVDYDTRLDLRNRAPGRVQLLRLQAHHAPGAQAPPVDELRLRASYDAGEHWRRVPVIGWRGHFLAILAHPRDARSVSLELEATDRAGNRLEQTVLHAWQLG